MLRPKAESEIFFRGLKTRATLFGAVLFIGFAIMAIRLWNLQVIQYQQLAARAENNSVRERVLEGLRGKIFDRNGITLVDNRPSFDLSIVPEDAGDASKVLALLHNTIEFDIDAALAEIRNSRPFKPVIIKKGLEWDEIAFVEEHKFDIPGISLTVKPVRNYLYGQFAAHLIGYLGSISPGQYKKADKNYYGRNDVLGQSGLEQKFEATLRGRKGKKIVEVDAEGREIEELGKLPARSGTDLTLTIDKAAQDAAEKAFEGKMGAAVALDPNNGEILAFVSKPSFNPNDFAMGIESDKWRALVQNEFHPLQNRAIRGQYPPGSTYKLLVATAALAEGIIDENTTLFCPGHFTLGRRTYNCWKKVGHGAVNVHKAIVQSCDVFFYRVGLALGIDKIAEYADKFGLGKKINFGMRGEKSGLIPSKAWKKKWRKEKWIRGETVSCSIGQGYDLVTPIQMARFAALFANGGSLVMPHLVADKPEKNLKPVKTDLPEYAINIVRKGMLGVVHEPHGTAWRLKLEKMPYRYAGKTGTSQVIRMKKNVKWEHEKMPIKFRDHGWFVAFAPFENPKIAVAVIAEHGGHGGEAAAPVAKAIIDAYMRAEPVKKRKPIVKVTPPEHVVLPEEAN